MEAARRASLAEEEARQMRTEELVVGASSSKTVEIAGGTADTAVDGGDTTEGVQIYKSSGFRGTGPTNLLIVGALRPRFASLTTLVVKFFLCIGDNCMSFCWW